MNLKFFFKVLLVFLSTQGHCFAQKHSDTQFCSPINSFNISFQIKFEGSSLTLTMKDKRYQLPLVDKYVDKGGELNLVFKNNLLTVISSNVSTAVATNSISSSDQIITIGQCK